MSTTTKTTLRPDAALVAAALAKVAGAPRVTTFEGAIAELKHEPPPSLWSAYVQWRTDNPDAKDDELERTRRAAKLDADRTKLSERPDTAYAKAIADARAAHPAFSYEQAAELVNATQPRLRAAYREARDTRPPMTPGTPTEGPK
jgi:hypothetical protein